MPERAEDRLEPEMPSGLAELESGKAQLEIFWVWVFWFGFFLGFGFVCSFGCWVFSGFCFGFGLGFFAFFVGFGLGV